MLTTIEIKIYHPTLAHFMQSLLFCYRNLELPMIEREIKLYMSRNYPDKPYKWEVIKTK